VNRLSENINFLASAASSTAKARKANPSVFTSDSLDVAVALKCIGSYQLQSSIEDLIELDEEENATPLIAAARTLQSISEHLATLNTHDHETINELRLAASIAHAMYGNFPSAKAAIRAVSHDYMLESPMRCISAVICDPTGPLAIQKFDPFPRVEEFRFNWFHSLRDDDSHKRDAHLLQVEVILKDITLNKSDQADRSLALSLQIAIRQAHRLSTASLYEKAPEIPRWFVKNAIASNIVTLLPPQYDLLIRRRLAALNGNSLLTLPTSTGKTLIAEACMASASSSAGLSIYIAPYVAIGEQVRASLTEKLRDHIPLISKFGGFKFESLKGTDRHALMIMTPERFDAWLRVGGYLEDIRLVVFDEVHIVENGSRGARVEGLISRLRMLQLKLPQLRILGLSAVLAEPENVASWMGVPQNNLHRISWRPTARRIAICSSKGIMQWLHGNDVLRPFNKSPVESLSESVAISLPERVKPSRNPLVYEAKASRNVAAIALDLLQRLGKPGLIVCPKRVDTRLLARSLAGLLPMSNDESIFELSDSITERYSWLNTLAICLRHGVAYHNASLPYDVRRDIEKATRDGKLAVVCSTTTLAEGADLPFRWTLVSHWLGSNGEALKPMTFRNIAGRCGRAGAFTEGDTILFENKGGPPEAYQNVRMSEELSRVMFGSAPIQSTAGENYLRLEQEERLSIKAAFSSQLLACIKENKGIDNIVDFFSNATYAIHDHFHGNNIKNIFNEALSGLLDVNRVGGPLAVINSPVQLTPLGEAANLSGFSPDSAHKILEYLAKSRTLVPGIELFANLLIHFSHLDEQQNYLWRNIVSKPSQRHPLKLLDIQIVLEKLLQKMDYREIFDQLPARVRSQAGEDTVEKQFDKFVSLIDSLISNFLPWLLRGLSSFAPFVIEEEQYVDWNQFAIEIENLFDTKNNGKIINSDDDPF
tara:strand:+ start:20625 stop:23435 length:2811 start_codon:yes stop_codon:yes gene_type:complete